MPPLLVLVGPPGSGKTTVGRLVAKRFGVDFRDTDADVAATAGKSISDVFIEDGEPAFRSLEKDAVEKALAKHEGVVALGGGAILDTATREQLRDHTVVQLSVEIADAARRVGFNRDRPLLLGNPRAQWLKLMEARRPLYDDVSTFTVETDGIPPNLVADRIVAILQKDET
jgi:shikimate kinase